MKNLSWIQFGRRHNFWIPSFLSDYMKVNLHYAYYKKIKLKKDITKIQYRYNHLIPAILNKCNLNINVDMQDFIYIDRFHEEVLKNLDSKVDILYTLSNGYPLITEASAKFKIHEQVSCTLELAKLTNFYEKKRINIDLLY